MPRIHVLDYVLPVAGTDEEIGVPLRERQIG
jgi:hypothetical protein